MYLPNNTAGSNTVRESLAELEEEGMEEPVGKRIVSQEAVVHA
jgi:hypothetical protein